MLTWYSSCIYSCKTRIPWWARPVFPPNEEMKRNAFLFFIIPVPESCLPWSCWRKHFVKFSESPADVVGTASRNDPAPIRRDGFTHAQWLPPSSPSFPLTLASPANPKFQILLPTELARWRASATAAQSICKCKDCHRLRVWFIHPSHTYLLLKTCLKSYSFSLTCGRCWIMPLSCVCGQNMMIAYLFISSHIYI